MAESVPNPFLNQLSTCWSVVQRAHTGPDEQMASARRELLVRYGGAVARYLHGALRDPAAAEELYQEFALRFLRGDSHRANPEGGRFRDFVKTALLRMVSRHGERRRTAPCPLSAEVADVSPAAGEREEQAFLRSWRAELLGRAWQALERLESATGRPYYRVMRLRVEQPDLSSAELADHLTAIRGVSVTAAGFRQTLHRAREAFAGLLLDEVSRSLKDPSRQDLERELAELGLLEYCRCALPADH
jgi:DNA-directed RNA polymerase specialized sigma24 family protein